MHRVRQAQRAPYRLRVLANRPGKSTAERQCIRHLVVELLPHGRSEPESASIHQCSPG